MRLNWPRQSASKARVTLTWSQWVRVRVRVRVRSKSRGRSRGRGRDRGRDRVRDHCDVERGEVRLARAAVRRAGRRKQRRPCSEVGPSDVREPAVQLRGERGGVNGTRVVEHHEGPVRASLARASLVRTRCCAAQLLTCVLGL